MAFTPLVAPVNLSTDLVDSVALRTTAALRYADHHLNAGSSVMLQNQHDDNVELFCVSQACITFPVANLKERLQNTRIHSGTVIPVVLEMWIQSLGKASISFGHVITFEDQILAKMTRIYVRKNVETGALVQVSERERLQQFPATPRHHNIEVPSTTKLEVPSIDTMQPLLRVVIGPQHCNNDHVDHAALADLLLQGLNMQGYQCEMHKLSINYLLPGKLHQTVAVCVHKDQPFAALYEERTSTPMAVGEIGLATRNKL